MVLEYVATFTLFFFPKCREIFLTWSIWERSRPRARVQPARPERKARETWNSPAPPGAGISETVDQHG